MSFARYIQHLENRLHEPLPGQSAHYKMAATKGRLASEAPPHASHAAVLIPLLNGENAQTVFIQRKKHEKDKHSGQISFPGGKLEASDISLEACALREAHEEIGLEPSRVTVMGRLTPLYIPVSNFLVTPVLAYTHEDSNLVPQPSEVDDVIRVDLSYLLQSQLVDKTNIKTHHGITLKNVPYFRIHSKVVWGATAMILSEFLSLLDA